MNEPLESTTTRREMLRRSVRTALAVGISAGSLTLVLRSSRSAAACSGTGVCGQCERLAECGLPSAAEARATTPGAAFAPLTLPQPPGLDARKKGES